MLSELIAGWDASRAIPSLERDLALEKLRALYEALRFGPEPTSAADGAETAAQIDLGDILSLEADFQPAEGVPAAADVPQAAPAAPTAPQPVDVQAEKVKLSGEELSAAREDAAPAGKRVTNTLFGPEDEFVRHRHKQRVILSLYGDASSVGRTRPAAVPAPEPQPAAAVVAEQPLSDAAVVMPQPDPVVESAPAAAPLPASAPVVEAVPFAEPAPAAAEPETASVSRELPVDDEAAAASGDAACPPVVAADSPAAPLAGKPAEASDEAPVRPTDAELPADAELPVAAVPHPEPLRETSVPAGEPEIVAVLTDEDETGEEPAGEDAGEEPDFIEMTVTELAELAAAAGPLPSADAQTPPAAQPRPEEPAAEPAPAGTILGEVINRDVQTLGDTLAAQHDAAPELRLAEPVTDLKRAIGINDKFLMMRDLFGGDGAAFDRALDALNACADFDDCMIYIAENHAWNADSDGAKLLMELLERKYA